jgi:hypothetical protein
MTRDIGRSIALRWRAAYFWWLVAGLFVALAVAGPTAAQEPGGTGEVEVPPTPTPWPAGTLFADDFEDPNYTYLPQVSPNASRFVVGYTQGEYLVRRTETALAGTTEIPVPDRDGNPTLYGDAVMMVDVHLVGTVTPPRYVRLTCRGRSGEESEYRLLVQPGDRQFRIERRDRGIPTPLVDWRVSNAVRPGTQVNQLELSCVGSTISAVINGESVASVEDATYPTGRMELGVFAPSTALEARFDNLRVFDRSAAAPAAPEVPAAPPVMQGDD